MRELLRRRWQDAWRGMRLHPGRMALIAAPWLLGLLTVVPLLWYEADRALHGTWFAAMDKMYLWSTLQNAHADYSRFRMLDTITSGGLAEVIAGTLMTPGLGAVPSVAVPVENDQTGPALEPLEVLEGSLDGPHRRARLDGEAPVPRVGGPPGVVRVVGERHAHRARHIRIG